MSLRSLKIIQQGMLSLILALCINQANATIILGGDLIVTDDGEVTIIHQEFTASIGSDLYLFTDDGVDGNDLFILNNKTNPIGEEISLGSFNAGDSLLFYIINNQGYTFFSGSDASMNPDGILHAAVDTEFTTVSFLLGFEDLFEGYDFDYDDLNISLTNVTVTAPDEVPEPSTVVLLLMSILIMSRKWLTS